MKRTIGKTAALFLAVLLLFAPTPALASGAQAPALTPAPVSLSITALTPSGKSLLGPVTEVVQGTPVKVKFKVGLKSNMQLTILDAKGSMVRTVTKSNVNAGSGFIQWDGKASGGKTMKYAAYTFKLTATPVDKSAGSAAAVKQTVITMAKSTVKIVNNPSVLYIPRDKLVFDFSYNTRGNAIVKISKGGVPVVSSTFVVYAHIEGTAEAMFYSWDMKKDDGTLAEAGKYVVSVTVKNGASSSTKSFTMEVRKMRS